MIGLGCKGLTGKTFLFVIGGGKQEKLGPVLQKHK
jgi:hypothetical protein